LGFISAPIRLLEIFWIVVRYYRAIYDNIAIFSEGAKYRTILANKIAVHCFANNIVMLVTEVKRFFLSMISKQRLLIFR
jgi:hypothetical protein